MERAFTLRYQKKNGPKYVTVLRYLSSTVILPNEVILREKEEVCYLDQTKEHVTFIAREDREENRLKDFLSYLKKQRNRGQYRIAKAPLGLFGDLFFSPTDNNADNRRIVCTFFPRAFPIPQQQSQPQPQPPPQLPRVQNPTRPFVPPPFVTTQFSQTANYIRPSDPRVYRKQSLSGSSSSSTPSSSNEAARVPSPPTPKVVFEETASSENVSSPQKETASSSGPKTEQEHFENSTPPQHSTPSPSPRKSPSLSPSHHSKLSSTPPSSSSAPSGATLSPLVGDSIPSPPSQPLSPILVDTSSSEEESQSLKRKAQREDKSDSE